MKKIICFGDTVTEMGLVMESRGFVARLAERYARRADVLARGFSGYTTREALTVLGEAVLAEKPQIVIVHFGCNDSVTPKQVTHVPLDEFKDNLTEIATQIALSGAWLILVTPLPVDERKTRSREMEITARYARACYEIGLDMNLPVLDLFHRIQEVPGWEKRCLLDGIHLTPHGMDILYEMIVAEMDKQFPLQQLARLGVPHI